MKKDQININNFDVIETVISLSLIDKSKNEEIVPVIIMSLNHKDLPWNYEQWDLISINFNFYEISINFSFQDKIINIIIDNNNYDQILIKNLEQYKHFILNISNDVKDDISFYLEINN